jgi:hypothetical protein
VIAGEFAAVGGGMEVAIACDIIPMAETAFALPEMQRYLADGGAVQSSAPDPGDGGARIPAPAGAAVEEAALGLVHKVISRLTCCWRRARWRRRFPCVIAAGPQGSVEGDGMNPSIRCAFRMAAVTA